MDVDMYVCVDLCVYVFQRQSAIDVKCTLTAEEVVFLLDHIAAEKYIKLVCKYGQVIIVDYYTGKYFRVNT